MIWRRKMGHLAVIPTLKTVIYEAERYGCDPHEVATMFLMDVVSALFGIDFTLSLIDPRSREAEGWRVLKEGIAELSAPAWRRLEQEANRLVESWRSVSTS